MKSKNVSSTISLMALCTMLGCSGDVGDSALKAVNGTDSSSSADKFATLSGPDKMVEIQDAREIGLGLNIDQPALKYPKIKIEKSVMIPMRDGVRLSADIYSPVGVSEPLPVILMRLPYNKNGMRHKEFTNPGAIAQFFASQGYVVVGQDMRGRWESEGAYTVSKANRDDGYDTVDWLSKQSWSTGKVGTYGCSYLGESQLMLAATRHPSHRAAIPQGAGGGYLGTYRPFGAAQGGTFELASGGGWFWNFGTKIFYHPPQGLSKQLRRSLSGSVNTKPKNPLVDLKKMFWHLPIVDMFDHYGGPVTDYEDFVTHSPADPYFTLLNYINDEDIFDVPALHINSWFDGTPKETTRVFNLMRENAVSERGRNQYMIMSPTSHCQSEYAGHPDNVENTSVGDLSVGDIRLQYFDIYLKWFDYWLKEESNDVLAMPKVQYYLMGANQWQSSETWPLANTSNTKFYLHSDGSANTRNGSGVLSRELPDNDAVSDRYTYDPADPVPSVGGPICCISHDAAPAGSYDQSEVELRNDVLVYNTPVLEQAIDVVGEIKVQLYVSSSAADTDFTVKLVDVYPDGTAYNIQEAILRARYREGFDNKVLMEEGEVYPMTIDLHVTANRFKPGHQLRLEVSSSNFPRFDRNLNTGGNNYDESEWVVADNIIHHSQEYPSHIVLPLKTPK